MYYANYQTPRISSTLRYRDRIIENTQLRHYRIRLENDSRCDIDIVLIIHLTLQDASRKTDSPS
jgi:hypothetical protein